MSGFPEGVSRGPWSCVEGLNDDWVLVDTDGEPFARFFHKDDAEYVVDTMNVVGGHDF